MSNSIRSCAVVGAGMAGLMAAHELISAGIEVHVFEKGRGAGGRMATRRMARAVFDHGAQFFTAREPRFAEAVARWQAAGFVQAWSRGFPSPGQAPAEALDGHTRYRGAPGMTAVPKYLAQGARVVLNTRIEAVMPYGSGWLVLPDSQPALEVDAVVLTPPVPQGLAVLEAGMVELPPQVRADLTALAYHPCLAVLALLDGASAVPAPGAVQVGGEPLAWVADNGQKGVSPLPGALTLHGGPAFSRAYWEAEDAAVAEALFAAARDWIPGRVKTFEVKRWRYSKPVDTYPARCLAAFTAPPLVFAGDAFAGPRVEGAALSGLAAADWLLGR